MLYYIRTYWNSDCVIPVTNGSQLMPAKEAIEAVQYLRKHSNPQLVEHIVMMPST